MLGMDGRTAYKNAATLIRVIVADDLIENRGVSDDDLLRFCQRLEEAAEDLGER